MLRAPRERCQGGDSDGAAPAAAKNGLFWDEAAKRKHHDRITLLEHTVQLVCNVATSSSRKMFFPGYVDLTSNAVVHARGRLGVCTNDYILWFYLFVLNFRAIEPTPSSLSYMLGDGSSDSSMNRTRTNDK